MGAPFFICICACAGSRKGSSHLCFPASVDSTWITSRVLQTRAWFLRSVFVKVETTTRRSPYMAAGDTLVARVHDLPARSEAAAVTLTVSISPPTRVRESVCLDVLNTATHAIRVRSAAHFFEVNRALKFDRAAARHEAGSAIRNQRAIPTRRNRSRSPHTQRGRHRPAHRRLWARR